MFSSIVFALILTLSTKASAPSAAPPTPALPECGNVTKSQVEAAVGHLLDRETHEYTKLACIRNFSSDDIEVTISIQHLAQPLDIPADLQNLEESLPDSKLWEVEGLAKRVLALDIPGIGVQLHVLPGERDYLLIFVQGLNETDHGYHAAMDIARTLMNRR